MPLSSEIDDIITGEFVVIRKEMDEQEWPTIWRVEGKNLLQKFQSFKTNDKILYTNISTVSFFLVIFNFPLYLCLTILSFNFFLVFRMDTRE